MSGNLSNHLPHSSEHRFYDHVLTHDQKMLFQTKINGNDKMITGIQEFCLANKCEKEEIYDYACRIYEVGSKTKSADYHHIGAMHQLPKLQERFGVKEGEYVFEKIILSLVSYLITTKSIQSKYLISQDLKAEEIADVLQEDPAKNTKPSKS